MKSLFRSFENAGAALVASLIACTLFTVPSFGQTPPSAVLDNGQIHAVIYLPDSTNGFYRGTRFDWAGIVGKLTAGGHTYYDQWFTRTDPAGGDFVYQGGDIVAGPASSAMGVPEEFSTDDNLGYSSAPVGGTFIKIGVGILRKPEEAKYNHYTHYEIVDGGKRTVSATKTSITFTQELLDKSTGYGYLYTKTIRLVPNTSQMVLEHTLKNTGTRAIEGRVYDHNFLTLDRQSPGPDFTITTPFPITPKRPIKTELGSVNGNVITYNKVLQDEENFSVAMGGHSDKASDYDFAVENKKVNAKVRIQGDKPLESVSLWSMRATLAIEPYIKLSIAPGQETEWKYTYTYGPATTGTK
jgi:hypothetical protein